MSLQSLPFTLDILSCQGFFEVQYNEPTQKDFQLQLKERDADDVVAWLANIQKRMHIHYTPSHVYLVHLPACRSVFLYDIYLTPNLCPHDVR